MTPKQLRAARLTSQLLAGPPGDSAESVTARILAIQAQDPRGARLALRARSGDHLAAKDVDAAFTDRRSLVITWLNRGTLHLVTPDDYWWLHPLTTPQLVTSNDRRLRQEGVSAKQAAKGVDVVLDAVAEGPRTREQLRTLLDIAKVPTARQALVHVLVAASIDGDLVRGPMIGKQHAFVRASEWLGPPPPPLERDEALARLAGRYLAGHAPAEPLDLAKFAGITLGDARDAFAFLERADSSPEPAPPPAAKLLGGFDPILHGWASRAEFVGEYAAQIVHGGLFRPTVLVDGRVVGTWRIVKNDITTELFEPIAARAQRALDAEVQRVRAFLAG